MLGVMQLRSNLRKRIEAAYFHGEPTIIRNDRAGGEIRAALVSYEWYQRARAALGEDDADDA